MRAHIAVPRMVSFVIATVFLLLAPPLAVGFHIVEPTEKTAVESGKAVAVSVDLGKDEGVVKVRYYWYRASGEAILEQSDQETLTESSQTQTVSGQPFVAIPALIGLSSSTPPFGGNLPVPKDAIGAMRLLAIADISRGRLGTRTSFDEVIVQVEPPAALMSIDFETEKPWKLGRIGQGVNYEDIDVPGKLLELPIVGLFGDGVTRPISDPSTGTKLTSSNDQVVKIEAYNLLRLQGSGTTILTATNREKSATLEVITDLSEEPNEPPVADAGESRHVKAGKKVDLNGLKSRDPEGEALSYYWSQIRGNHISLLDPNMPRASFLAPVVSEPRTYRFKLRVTDKKGADSLPAFVDITVEP